MEQNFFTELENNKPFAKIALEGFAGDGKTFTAVELAIGIHKLINSTKPIASIDTEKAIDKLKWKFDEAGIKVQTNQSRTLASLNKAMEICSKGFADILIIDSITHVWENFLQEYMSEKRRSALQFQDWGIIKPKWKKEFSDVFVQAPVHIIFTGRAGYEYETEIISEEGKKDRKEIFKSGIKMKAENETAFEPDMLVLMEKVQEVVGKEKKIYRNATIIKDRTTKIDGKTFTNPNFNDFYPAIKVLLDGTLKDIHTVSLPDRFEDFEMKFAVNSKRKNQSISEIEATFNYMKLGAGKEEKALKAAILNKIFGVKSIEMVESMQLSVIELGLTTLVEFSKEYLNYLESCAESAMQPDMVTIAQILDRCINMDGELKF